MKQKTNNNILQIIIIVLLIILIAIGGMILLKDHKKNIGTDNNTSQNDTNDVSKDYVIIKFDGTKAINPTNTESEYYLWDDRDYSLYTLGLSINQAYLGKRDIVFNVDFSNDSLSKEYEIDKLDQFMTYDINNFDKDIKKVYLAGFGQASGSETIFYIMEDGTVEYTPIRYILKNNDINDTTIFKSFGKIDGVTGVVKLLQGYETSPGLLGGGLTILGIKEDGTFYDLSKIIYDTQYYKRES